MIAMSATVPQRPVPNRADFRHRDERLTSLGLLAGQLAHDFNNLLAPILGYVTLIKEEFPAESSGQQYSDSLETAARRAEKLLDQTLLATRPQRRFSPKVNAFDELVAKEVAIWRAELPATSGVSVQTDLSPCSLVLDDFHWRIAIRQLLNNARFGCATGGHISIDLKSIVLTPTEAGELGLPDCNAARLCISDDGFGMPPEILSRAFEPFFTTRAKGVAQGLGLTACHSIVYLHGGQIELISAPDEGTKVTVWLPLKFLSPKAAVESFDTADSNKRPASAPKRRLLMVDDDPLVREVLKTSLLKAGYEVIVAEDGQAAWRMFSRFHKELGLVVSDFQMPLIDGVQLLSQMRELNPGVPVILLSGDMSGGIENKLREHHLWVEVVPKPCSLSQLLALVDDTVNREA